jgi:acetate kinase
MQAAQMTHNKEKNILVLNCGSSSIKFAIYHPEHNSPLCHGLIENVGSANTTMTITLDNAKQHLDIANHDYAQAMQALVDFISEHSDLMSNLAATGHRVVHGGKQLTNPAIITSDILEQIDACAPLAPLHNPANALGIRTMQGILPQIPHVAVFDTGFHQSIPAHAKQYALPHALADALDIQKYGFHGISYDYVHQALCERLGMPAQQGNTIIAHLGNGASLCAIKAGHSMDTSMGMTPLAGVMMGTRCGDIDAGIIPYIAQAQDLSLTEVMTLLTKESGLLGLSGVSHDMRDLLNAMDSGDAQATLALETFAYQIAKTIASYYVALQQVHGLAFTGGIGEHTCWLRQKVADHLAFLDIHIDEQHNQNHGQDQQGLIATPDSTKVYVIQTNEEYQIAKLTQMTTEEKQP